MRTHKHFTQMFQRMSQTATQQNCVMLLKLLFLPHSSFILSRRFQFPFEGRKMKCIWRDSNPGRSDGNAAWYPYTTDACFLQKSFAFFVYQRYPNSKHQRGHHHRNPSPKSALVNKIGLDYGGSSEFKSSRTGLFETTYRFRRGRS